MANEIGQAGRRFDIPYLEGVNSLVGHHISNKTEFPHAENARSVEIGTIEKREGQTVVGTAVGGGTFVTTKNDGLFYFPVSAATNQGLYRLSNNGTPGQDNLYYLNELGVGTAVSLIFGGSGYTTAGATVTTGGSGSGCTVSFTAGAGLVTAIVLTAGGTGYHNGETLTITTGGANATFTITTVNAWTTLAGKGAAIAEGAASFTTEGENMFIANYNDKNRYISSDGTTVLDSADAGGHLYNSPNAHLIKYYKNRLYLANYITNSVVYPTTVVRSSFPSGVIALINGDNPLSPLTPAGTITTTTEIFVNGVSTSPQTYNADTTTGATKLYVTDINYFYTTSGANTYDVYRGSSLVAVIVVTAIQELSIDITYTFQGAFDVTGKRKFLSSDQIWISGTYTGKKLFRWINNSSITGRDVKQYDTFKLSGGDNSSITMLETVGNVLLIGNKNSLASWNDYTLENLDLGIGCVSQQGYVKLLGNLYFIHYRGIFTTSGGPPQLISNKIQKYITGSTKAGREASAAGKKGTSVFFTLGDVTIYNSDHSIDKVLNDVCLEYNTTSQNWFVHSNVKASQFTTFLEYFDPDKIVYIDTAGNKAVKEFLKGSTDDGQEIFMRVDLNKMTFQSAYESVNTLNSLIIETERGNSLKAFISITEGNNEYYELGGVIEKGISILKISPQDDDKGEPTQCRLLQVSFRDSSVQTPKITRVSVIYTPDPQPSIVQ